jgi:uncharacterized protein YndB with AHSA1/START domain
LCPAPGGEQTIGLARASEMILSDSVEIRRPPSDVWAYVEDPEKVRLWNPKVWDVELLSWGHRDRGYRYTITYEMRGKTSVCAAEIVEYVAPSRFAVRLTGGGLPPGGFIEERYRLEAIPEGTRLHQTIHVHDARIGRLASLAIRLLSRFGRPAATPYLVNLKRLVEGSP